MPSDSELVNKYSYKKTLYFDPERGSRKPADREAFWGGRLASGVRTPGRSAAPRRTGTFPKAVLFDLDDTLFDHALTCRAALRSLRAVHPFLGSRSLREVAREYGNLLGATHTEVALGRRTTGSARTERFLRLAEWLGHPISRRLAAELSEQYRRRYLEIRRPVSGAPEFVRRLVGRTTIAVVTNHTTPEQSEKLVFLGIDRAVDALVTSGDVGAQKPDPAIFRCALRRIGVAAEDTVMIGDVWATDVVGARRAGVRPIWFNRFHLAAPAASSVPEFSSFRRPRALERLLRERSPTE
jgi:HAD superfamily hydrolase (TIGR01549 family)